MVSHLARLRSLCPSQGPRNAHRRGSPLKAARAAAATCRVVKWLGHAAVSGRRSSFRSSVDLLTSNMAAVQPARPPPGQPAAQSAAQPARQPGRQPAGQAARQPARRPAGQPARHAEDQGAGQAAGESAAATEAGRALLQMGCGGAPACHGRRIARLCFTCRDRGFVKL